jgi:hypothetical protein
VPFVFVLVLAGFAVVAYLQWQAKQKRREDIHAWAFKHGFEYSAQDVVDIPIAYDFALFGRGEGRGCENLLRGTWKGLPVVEADYWYYTTSRDSNGRTSRDYEHFSVVIAQIEAFLPRVQIERENILTRLADAVGLDDIDFESEDFNRRFNVKASNREFAFKLVDARMMQWLLGVGDKACVEVFGTDVLLWCSRLGSERVPALLDSAKAFVDHIPRLVWNEYGKAAS